MVYDLCFGSQAKDADCCPDGFYHLNKVIFHHLPQLLNLNCY